MEEKLPFRDHRYQKNSVSLDVLMKNLNRDYDLKISVGIWYFSPGGGRFHDRYVPEMSIEERIEKAAEMADLGVRGIEAHYPAEINEDNVKLYEELERSAGIKTVVIPFSHFFEKHFEFGSLSNPDKEIRRKAIETAKRGLRMVKRMGAECAVSWPGNDGYLYLHGRPYAYFWNLFEESMAEAMDSVPGVRVAIEPKPYEPAANNIYRTTAEAVLAAQRIEKKMKNEKNLSLLKKGHFLAGLNPEVGHVKMGFEMLPAAYSMTVMEGRLFHTHWNSQPDGNYDQDNNVGVVNPHEAEALLYSLWAVGYDGWFGIDINPEHMPVKKAVELNVKALHKMKERIARLPHEKILDCHLNPADNRGTLEDILLENL